MTSIPVTPWLDLVKSAATMHEPKRWLLPTNKRRHARGVTLTLADGREHQSLGVGDDVARNARGLHSCFAAQALGQQIGVGSGDRFDGGKA